MFRRAMFTQDTSTQKPLPQAEGRSKRGSLGDRADYRSTCLPLRYYDARQWLNAAVVFRHLRQLSEPIQMKLRFVSAGASFGLTIRRGWNGGRYRIRTYDFHRVKMALYR